MQSLQTFYDMSISVPIKGWKPVTLAKSLEAANRQVNAKLMPTKQHVMKYSAHFPSYSFGNWAGTKSVKALAMYPPVHAKEK
jgi:hypothetical protein